MRPKFVNNLFYGLCLLLVFVAGMQRSKPIYGKGDFYLVDGRPWWPAWRALIEDTRSRGHAPVYTDYITGYVLAGVFGERTVVNVGDEKMPQLYVEDMEEGRLPAEEFLSEAYIRAGRSTDLRCVINLVGYRSSWVPGETGHWKGKLANTARFYHVKNGTERVGEASLLHHLSLKNCFIFRW